MTALVVLLIALTGVAPKDVISARGLNTVAGGVIALVAYVAWPTWERTQAPDLLARMLDAYRDYFQTIARGYLLPEASFEAELDRTRLAARLARSNLEASVDRVSTEPGTPPEDMQSLNTILATSHRLVHALMAIESGLATSTPVPARRQFPAFAHGVEITLHSLAMALRGSPLRLSDLPDLRQAHRALTHSGVSITDRYALINTETDRITNSLNSLSEQVIKRLASGTNASISK